MSAQGQRILDDLHRHAHAFDFTKDDLGEKIAEAFAVGVFEMMEAETGPDGAWEPLSDRYDEWKSAHFPGQKMAELYGIMKDPEQLKGTLDVSPESMEQTYGLDDEAKDRAVFFQEGSDKQPPRPFYALNGLSERAVAEVLDQRFHDIVS